MRPTKPCPFCGATKYGVIDAARLELLTEAKRGWGNVAIGTFSVCVCTGCRATSFFSLPGDEGLLEMCDHEIVDVS